MTTTTTALASRDAAFAKALDDLTRERSNALSLHTMKERARNPAIGDGYIVACERAKAKYHAARALAQECYLAATAPPAEEWEPGLDDDTL